MKIIVPEYIDIIAFISDIHGMYENILKIVELKPEIRYWFCVGDVVDMYAPTHINAPTVRLMNKLKIPSILGNHDRYIRKNELHLFEPKNQEYLKAMPFFMDINFAGYRIGVFHATPSSLTDFMDDNSEETKFEQEFGNLDFDVIVLGHTHKYFSKQIGKKQFINPGSLGPNSQNSTFCTLDKTKKVDFIFIN